MPSRGGSVNGNAAYERVFTFERYGQAVAKRERLLREANEAQEALEAANAEVSELEAELGKSFEMAKAEVRLYAKGEVPCV